MAVHEYKCKNNHITSIVLVAGDTPRIMYSCSECGKDAYYNWAGKRIAGTVRNGTGGGNKMNKYLRQNKKKGENLDK